MPGPIPKRLSITDLHMLNRAELQDHVLRLQSALTFTDYKMSRAIQTSVEERDLAIQSLKSVNTLVAENTALRERFKAAREENQKLAEELKEARHRFDVANTNLSNSLDANESRKEEIVQLKAFIDRHPERFGSTDGDLIAKVQSLTEQLELANQELREFRSSPEMEIVKKAKEAEVQAIQAKGLAHEKCVELHAEIKKYRHEYAALEERMQEKVEALRSELAEAKKALANVHAVAASYEERIVKYQADAEKARQLLKEAATLLKERLDVDPKDGMTKTHLRVRSKAFLRHYKGFVR